MALLNPDSFLGGIKGGERRKEPRVVCGGHYLFPRSSHSSDTPVDGMGGGGWRQEGRGGGGDRL